MAALRTLAVCLVLASSIAYSQSANNAYVGSKACYGCHTAIYKSFAATDMGHSITAAAEWHPDSVPGKASVAQPGTSRNFSVSHTEKGWFQTESEPGVFSIDHPLDFVVGSGYNGLTFLIRRGSYLFQAPLSYYSRAQKWDLSPGYEQVDLGFSRMVPEECINCHSGRPAPLAGTHGAYADPPFHELSIGCENCHGPGEAHIKSNGKGSIVNPARLQPRLADNICLNCHQSGDARVTQPGRTLLDFRPGQWLFNTAVIFKQPVQPGQQPADLLEHYSAMQASRCFRESGSKLSCLTCHDPHAQPRNKEEVATYYRAKCLTCHAEQSCRLSLDVRKTNSDDCVSCHMPKRDVTQISHSALTNHRIPARSDEALPVLKQIEQGGLILVNPPEGPAPEISKLILLRAYKQVLQRNPEYLLRYRTLLEELSKSSAEDTFVQAALGDKAFGENRFDDAVQHLKLALAEGNSAVYLELGESLAKLGHSGEAIEYLKKGIQIDPYNAAMQKTLILQYINLKAYGEARQQMEEYVAMFPEDTLMRGLLARVSQ